jgi:cytidine deaminase
MTIPWQELEQAAQQAVLNAYVPASGFSVGAALLDESGTVHRGCNVENASFGLTSCAERNAVFAAVASGVRPGAVRALVLYTPTEKAVSPCGACRQVLAEFMPAQAPVRALCKGPDQKEWTVEQLLPDAFAMKEGG